MMESNNKIMRLKVGQSHVSTAFIDKLIRLSMRSLWLEGLEEMLMFAVVAVEDDAINLGVFSASASDSVSSDSCWANLRFFRMYSPTSEA